MIAAIIAALKTEIQTALGSDYSELAFNYDLSKNPFKGSKKKFGVKPLYGYEVSGVTRAVTIDQTFRIMLTSDYSTKSTGDDSLAEQVIVLHDKAIDLYKRIYNTKAGLGNVIAQVKEVTVSEPEILTDSVIVITCDLVITYRTLL